MPGGLLEIADVRSQMTNSAAGRANLTIIGYGGSIVLGLNYLQNVTAELPGEKGSNTTVQVDMLTGSNVLTIYQQGDDSVWLNAVVVG